MARIAKISAVLVAVAAPGVAVAQDAELPPTGLLEYLGSWQDDDEEWFVDAELGAPPTNARKGRRSNAERADGEPAEDERARDEQTDDERVNDEHE